MTTLTICNCMTMQLHLRPCHWYHGSLTVSRQLRRGWPLAGCVLIPLRLSSSGLVPPGPTGPVNIAGASVRPSQQVRDLGVVLDSELSLVAHVSHITSVCYCQIRQLRLLRRSLSFEAAHALVRALVHSRLDYCNAVLANAPQMLVAPSSPFCALLLGLY